MRSARTVHGDLLQQLHRHVRHMDGLNIRNRGDNRASAVDHHAVLNSAQDIKLGRALVRSVGAVGEDAPVRRDVCLHNCGVCGGERGCCACGEDRAGAHRRGRCRTEPLAAAVGGCQVNLEYQMVLTKEDCECEAASVTVNVQVTTAAHSRFALATCTLTSCVDVTGRVAGPGAQVLLVCRGGCDRVDHMQSWLCVCMHVCMVTYRPQGYGPINEVAMSWWMLPWNHTYTHPYIGPATGTYEPSKAHAGASYCQNQAVLPHSAISRKGKGHSAKPP